MTLLWSYCLVNALLFNQVATCKIFLQIDISQMHANSKRSASSNKASHNHSQFFGCWEKAQHHFFNYKHKQAKKYGTWSNIRQQNNSKQPSKCQTSLSTPLDKMQKEDKFMTHLGVKNVVWNVNQEKALL